MAIQIKHILFVCAGNICRSPFAEGLLKALVAEKKLEGIVADSAGLVALPGNLATALAQRVATEYGVDLSGHQAKLVSQNLMVWADLVLAMEPSHKETLRAAFPVASGKVLLLRHFGRYGSRGRGILDPYGLEYEAYRFCFLDIQDAVLGLVTYLQSGTMPVEPV